jgi:hypothetical protein
MHFEENGFVTLTLVRYPEVMVRWAVSRMAFDRRPLARTPGLRFWKLLGTGKNAGFDTRPNWDVWGLLAVWAGLSDYEAFAAASPVARGWRARAVEQWTVHLRPLSSHGAWNGRNPFGGGSMTAGEVSGPIAVLTRATIRPMRLARFWGAVPAVQRRVETAEGLLAAYGIGELPFLRQATFSLWRDAEAMRCFARGSAEHAEVVRRTREEGWYAEELFARFVPLGTTGTLYGVDPLAGLR